MMLYFERYNRAMGHLNNEQFGKLMKTVFKYAQGEDVTIDDATVEIVFDMLKYDIDKDAENYEKLIESRRQAGIKSGQSRRTRVQSVQQNEHMSTHVHCVEQNEPIPTTVPIPKPIPKPIPVPTSIPEDGEWVEFVKTYEQNIGLMPSSQYELEELTGLYEALGMDVMKEAIRITALQHPSNPHKYMRSVCRNWMQSGVTTIEQAKAATLDFQNRRSGNDGHNSDDSAGNKWGELSGITYV